MKLSTKSLLSALIAAIVNSTSGERHVASQRSQRRYERVLQKHDRKGELRASILGIKASEFREQERKHSLSILVHPYGFANERAFYQALVGRIRQELRWRGWTPERIQYFEEVRLQRITQ